MTRTEGTRSMIWRVASIPFRSGMPMSMTTTWGRRRLGHLDGGAAVLGLGDHFEVLLGREQSAKSLAEDAVVVR